MTNTGLRPVVAIIGGGFTGAAIAHHLDRLLAHSAAAEIVVIEPRATLGAGLAYATDDPAHRINVPASRMSLDPLNPGEFDAWFSGSGEAAVDPEAALADGRRFPRRHAFGRYMAESLAPALAAGRIIHRCASVLRVDEAGEGYWLLLSDRSTLEADLVVIATTHPPPAVPEIFSNTLGADKRLIRDATRRGALDDIAADDRVLIVGTGLTMADAVASLEAAGHRGSITAFSRRGQLSAPHPQSPVLPFGDFISAPAHTAAGLVRRIREAVAQARMSKIAEQAVFDALRAQGRGIWEALSLVERKRLVRHLRVFWDARRFRIAPQVYDVVARLTQRGQLRTLAARAKNVTADPSGVTATLVPRNGSPPLTIVCDRVIITTGPAYGELLHRVPYLIALADAGLVKADDVGLGLATDLQGRAVGRDGSTRDTLRIGGPLARATFGELMGLPEVALYAVELAEQIARWAEIQQQDTETAQRKRA